jgi:surfeit locus 1 family protein
LQEYIAVLNFSRSRFAPRLGPTLLAASAIALFVVLGNWQLGRAHEKRQLTDRFTAGGPAIDWKDLPADAPRYQPVRLSGHYDKDHQFLLDNMSHESMAGVDVLTPFVLNGGSTVLVNRGWQPYGATRQDLPNVEVDSGQRTIVGRLDDLPRPGIWLKAPPATGWPRLVQYPQMEELSIALGLELAPRQVLLDPAVPDGYVRAWKLPGTEADQNLSYAVQWFAFAAMAGVIWLVLSFRKREVSP